MAAAIFHEPVFATIVESGDKLYFYEVGTTTDLTVYLDAALSTPASQPVVADSFGRFPPLYLDTTANHPKVVLEDFNSVEKWTTQEYPLEDTASLAQDVAQLQIDVEAAEGVGLANQSDIVQLQTEVADHETRITALEDAEVDFGNIGKGAKISRSTTQPAASGTTTITYSSTDFDDATIVVANVITVPEGISRVMVNAGLRLSIPGTGLYTVRMIKNGSFTNDLPYVAYHPSGSSNIIGFNLASGIMSVSEGDTFGVQVIHSESTATVQAGTWLSLSVLI